MTEGKRRDEIVSILNRYYVRKHYQASSAHGFTLYAVSADGRIVTEAGTHAEATAARENLIVEDILALFGKDAACESSQ